jgi:hypothetical protein
MPARWSEGEDASGLSAMVHIIPDGEDIISEYFRPPNNLPGLKAIANAVASLK